MTTRFRDRLRDREPLIGTFLFLPSPDVAEAAARTGLDFVIIDMEHSPKSWQTVSEMVRAAQLGGTSCLIRVATNSPEHILHALEVGADGIVLPWVENAADVARAVAAARYAPIGNRGTCTMSRAASYGLGRDSFATHAFEQNDSIVLIGQVESAGAIDRIDEIVSASPGLDAVIVGRADLASSIGQVGLTAHPEVITLTGRVMERMGRLNTLPFGLAVYGPEEAAEWTGHGASLFVHSTDVSMIVNGYRETVASFGSVKGPRTDPGLEEGVQS